MSAFVVTLQGGAPWGLRLQGGSGTGEPLRIAKINPGSKAARAQLHVGDIVETLNGVRTGDLALTQAQKLLHNKVNDLQLTINRKQQPVNGSLHPEGKMSSQSSLIVTNDSGFSGTGSQSLDRKPSQEDGVIQLDGVTLQGFDPGSVQVVRTTTTKVTKVTRSRSPSPVTVRRLSSDGSPHLARPGPGRIRMRITPTGHDSESEISEAPSFASYYSTGSKAPSREDSQGWRPVPFSPPPVPPPPGDVTDTEVDEPPKVPPKPKSVKTNIWLTANQPGQQLGSPTSPPLSPTNGYPMTTAQQKEEPPPPIMDIPSNNNNLRKDEDEFWPPPPPPPDESKDRPPPPPPPPKPRPKVMTPSAPSPPEVATRHDSRPDAPNRKVIPPPRKFGFKPFKPYAPSGEEQQRDMWTPSDAHGDLPPPPPLGNPDSHITAPVWAPSGVQAPKKEFKSVRPDLTPKSKASTVQPVSSAPPAVWTPPSQPPAAPLSPSQTSQPLSVDTLSDPSHILARGFASPQPKSPQQPVVVHSAPSQDQYAPPPPPPPTQAPYFPAGPAPPAPVSSGGGPPPTTQGVPVQYDGIPNGYGFIPASAVSGSSGALTTDLLTWGTQPGSAPSSSTNDNSSFITDPTKLPPGALFQKQTVEGDVVHTDTFYPIQNVTRNSSTVKKHEAPRYDGIGPRDKDGMPLGLRQHVKEDNRHDWYKEMFKSIHKQDNDEDMTESCYRSRHRYPHEIEDERKDDSSDSVFVSENETVHAGDSWKTVTQKDYEPEPVVKNTPAYRVQPGKITDFVPGQSALATHERNIQAQKEPAGQGRRMSAPGSGYGSDEEARKAYRNFVKSGQLPSQGLGLGAPQVRRENKPYTASPTQSSNHSPPHHYHQPPPPSSSSSPSTPPSHGLPSPVRSWSVSGSTVPTATAVKSSSLPRSSLPKRKQRYSEGSGLSAAERLGIKTPPPSRLSASSTVTKPTVPDSRYDYMNQLSTADQRSSAEKKPREVREPDASYSKSLPEYNPIKSPNISDDRFDDFDFTPPVIVPVAKQEVLPPVERSPSPGKQITKASAVALYPFTAQSKKELSFKKGDTIFLTREVDKNWFEGEHHGSKGIFPRSYVEIRHVGLLIELRHIASPKVDKLTLQLGNVRLSKKSRDENLVIKMKQFKKRQKIDRENMRGINPAISLLIFVVSTRCDTISRSFLSKVSMIYSSESILSQVVTSIEEARNLEVNTPSAEGKGRAKYKFKGETANELSVNKGEIIDLVRRIDANWWEARVGGRAGIIPFAYLEVLREPQSGRAVSPQLSSGGPKGAPLSPAGRSPHSPTPVAKSPSYQTQSSNHMGYGPTGGMRSQPPSAHQQQQQQKPAAWNNGPVQGRGGNVGRPAQNQGFHRQGPAEASRQFGSPTQERYRAAYSYQPNNDDELELKDGDTVVVMEKCDDGWFVGYSESTGLFGTFPGNYVERL
ncbi:uncharacterized protein [Diadema antillarum]|uniref:uncharacterized protein n=1 Tax=Diadema antillarum TaxID=105358 RepID=UPI003A88DB9C